MPWGNKLANKKLKGPSGSSTVFAFGYVFLLYIIAVSTKRMLNFYQ